MKPYEFLDELTYADIAYIAYGNTIAQLFTNAALALSESMVDLDTLSCNATHEIVTQHLTIEGLLFSFLEELVLLKDSDQLLFKKFDNIRLEEKGALSVLRVTCHGDTIQPETQELRNDVKAVTYHEYKVELDQKPMRATIVLDV